MNSYSDTSTTSMTRRAEEDAAPPPTTQQVMDPADDHNGAPPTAAAAVTSFNDPDLVNDIEAHPTEHTRSQWTVQPQRSHHDADEFQFGVDKKDKHYQFYQSWRAAASEDAVNTGGGAGGVAPERRSSSSAGSRIRSAVEESEPLTRQNSHGFPVEAIAELLGTDLINGLDSAEAEARLKEYGMNKLHEPPGDTFLKRLWRQLNDALTWILLITSIISAGMQSWPEFGLILGIVVINITIGMVQEGKASKATAALKEMLSAKATVIRDNGQRKEIDAREIVPGDLVFVESGSKVPADLRLARCTNLAVQEAMLTGESLPVQKNFDPVPLDTGLGDRLNVLYSATLVVRGQGVGVCVATGDTTEIGRIAELVSEVRDSKSELLQRVNEFGKWIGMIVVPLGIITFLIAYLTPINLDTYYESSSKAEQAVVTAIAVAVSAIPAGLPAIITICMAVATKEMARRHAIVKTLPSVEALGAVAVICSDKTGTLTKNEMTAVAVRTRSREYQVRGVGYDSRQESPDQQSASHGDPQQHHGKTVVDNKSEPRLGSDRPLQHGGDGHPQPQIVPLEYSHPHGKDTRLLESKDEDKALLGLIRAGLLNNESRLERTPKQVLPIGDPTECSLICLGEKARMDMTSVSSQNPRVGVIPFESDHKFMVTFHSVAEDNDEVLVIVKGAPDRLLAKSHSSLLADGTVFANDHDFSAFWHGQIAHLSSKGYRCLALCQTTVRRDRMSDIIAQGPGWLSNAKEPFLTMLGLVAILDPPRPECIDAIKLAHRAGIVVKMITGDHPSTARAIGKSLGIVDEKHSQVLTGPELDAMSPEDLEKIVLDCNVYARASPDNKISIVRALQNRNLICSMTGDGVNDAPALRAADIGVAMGITGTDVSKDAAKIVLADDNFATILVAVRQGRRVWDNLRKIVLFNMPANFAQAGVIFLAVCLQWNVIPITAIQALYVNMIIACTLGLILALEPPEPKAMMKPPRRPGKGLIGKMFYWRIAFVSSLLTFFVLISVVWVRWLGVDRYQDEDLRSVAFNVLVFCQVGYAFNCRFLKLSSCHPRVMTGNPGAWMCAALVIGLNVLITYVPGLNTFFGMAPMDGVGWGIVFLFAVSLFTIVEIEKALTDPLKPCYLPIIRSLDKCFATLDRFNVFKCIARQGHKAKEMIKSNPKLRHGASLRPITVPPWMSFSRKKKKNIKPATEVPQAEANV